ATTAIYSLSLHDALPIYVGHFFRLGVEEADNQDGVGIDLPYFENFSQPIKDNATAVIRFLRERIQAEPVIRIHRLPEFLHLGVQDRKSTRLNSSHVKISY